MRKSMQDLVKEYDERYLPNTDRFKCSDVAELAEMAKKTAMDKGRLGEMWYWFITFSLQAGFMRGYRSACYDMKKRNR